MFVCVLILAMITFTFGTVSALSDLTKELLGENLILLDEAGAPTTICMVSLDDGRNIIQLCPMTGGFGPRSVGCFAVWNTTGVIQQGCYSNQEISLRSQCQKHACIANREQADVAFCCCHGPLCNANYARR